MDGSHRTTVSLGDPITVLSGIGARRAQDFGRVGVTHLEHLLTFWPRRHLDRAEVTPIWQVSVGSLVTVVGHIRSSQYEPRRGRPFLRVVVDDGTGTVVCTFFHASWLRQQMVAGRRILINGRADRFGRALTMTHPDFELLEDNEAPRLGLVPVYPLAGDLKARFVLQMMQQWLPLLVAQAEDPVPPSVRQGEGLPLRNWAIMQMHFPDNSTNREEARRRLVFDEFLRMSLAVNLLHGRADVPRGYAHSTQKSLMSQFLSSLPFKLTQGQQSAWQEIEHDLEQPRPMARLLQGDVGAGKTIVAVLTMLAAVANGRQAALMAPTELLAEQHVTVLRRLVEPLGVRVGLLAGRGRHLKEVRDQVREGTVQMVVGTQALLSDSVDFAGLGVVVVDEQHRFGVRQRAHLGDKGRYPDMLVMTATPIPRTLALTVYGDLDVSQISGLPPGRQPIQTFHLTSSQRREAYQMIRDRVRLGQQAYVVCPLVGENEEINAKAAVELAEGMRKIPGWRIGLVHGQMPSVEKNRVMGMFRDGDIDVLVATTIIEVGVDVPNASIMVIEQAERFGLAQLHQLRGRIGRGSHASICYLIADPQTEEGQARISAMVETQDGLALAERDLEIRGPGEVLGIHQHGVAGFQLANPLKDLGILERARQVARQILAEDPRLQLPQHASLRKWVREALDQALPGHVLH